MKGTKYFQEAKEKAKHVAHFNKQRFLLLPTWLFAAVSALVRSQYVFY
jgi:hypothetical protein